MRCDTWTDVKGFARQALPWLADDPVAHNVMSTVVDERAAGHRPVEPGSRWITVVDRLVAAPTDQSWSGRADQSEAIVGVAIATGGRGALLSTMPVAVASFLGDHLADAAAALPSVHGRADLAAAAASAYAARTGRAASAGHRARIFSLGRLQPPAGVPGQVRAASSADRELLVEWASAFLAAIEPPADPAEAALGVDSRLSQGGRLWLWESNGRAVSMAWLSTAVAGIIRVSGVYTPDSERGHGYASACVAAVSALSLSDDAVRGCMLLTDPTNRVTNKIYPAIGYQPVGEVQTWTFGPAPA